MTGLDTDIEVRVDGLVKTSARACAASRRRTRSWRRRASSGVEPKQAAVFEDALAGRRGGPGGELRVRRRRRPRRPARRAARARRGHRGRRPERAAVITQPAFTVEPWAVTEESLSSSTYSPRRSRCSRSPTATSACAATSTRASRSASPAPTSTASTRPARCRTRRPATATRRTARPSSTPPTARSSGCWSTTSRSTSATASCSSTRRTLDLREGTLTRHVRWRSPSGREIEVNTHPARLLRPALGGRDPLRGQGHRRRAAARSSPSPSWWPTSPPPRRRDDPRAAAALRGAAGGRGAGGPQPPRRARAPHQRSGLRMAAGMDHVVERRRRAGDRAPRRPPTSAASG